MDDRAPLDSATAITILRYYSGESAGLLGLPISYDPARKQVSVKGLGNIEMDIIQDALTALGAQGFKSSLSRDSSIGPAYGPHTTSVPKDLGGVEVAQALKAAGIEFSGMSEVPSKDRGIA